MKERAHTHIYILVFKRINEINISYIYIIAMFEITYTT